MHQITKMILRQVFRTPLSLQQNLVTRNSFSFAETSRDIEHKMRVEQIKNVENKFRALSTHFGLKCPK